MDIIHNNKPLSIYFDVVDNLCDEQCLSIKIIDTAIIIYKCTYVFNKLDNKNLFNNDIRVCIDMFTDLIKLSKYDITYDNHSIILNIHISFMSYFNYTYVFTCIEDDNDIDYKNTIVKLYNKIDTLETKLNELELLYKELEHNNKIFDAKYDALFSKFNMTKVNIKIGNDLINITSALHGDKPSNQLDDIKHDIINILNEKFVLNKTNVVLKHRDNACGKNKCTYIIGDINGLGFEYVFQQGDLIKIGNYSLNNMHYC